jgi:hypothetical protein
MRVVDSVIDSGRPIYVIKPMPALALKYQLDAAPTNLFRIAPTALPPPTFSSRAIVGDSLRVSGYTIVSGVPAPGGSFNLAVYWQPLKPLARNYKTSLQLFDLTQNKVAQGEDHQPGGEEYPSSLWQPGETLQDRFTLKLSPNVRRGVYHLFVRVYDAESAEALGDLTEIGTLNVIE